MQELSKKDERRLSKIKWRRAKNGKYFGKFDTKEEAYLCLKEFAERYRATPTNVNTIKDLCEEYQDKGIYIYPTPAGKWLKEVFNITVKYPSKYSGPSGKRTTTIRLERKLDDRLQGLADSGKMRSWWINAILKVHAGIPSKEIFVFMDGIDNITVTVLFYKQETEWRALYIGALHKSTRKLLQSLASEAEQHGGDYLVRKCEVLGFYVIDNREEND